MVVAVKCLADVVCDMAGLPHVLNCAQAGR